MVSLSRALYAVGGHRVGTDIIRLTGLQFFARHGVLEAEQTLGQRFEVDVSLQTDLRAAGQSDKLQHTVDYARVYTSIEDQVVGPSNRKDLIEAVAEGVAARILREHAAVQGVRVEVRKPQVALGGILAHVAVVIERSRETS